MPVHFFIKEIVIQIEPVTSVRLELKLRAFPSYSIYGLIVCCVKHTHITHKHFSINKGRQVKVPACHLHSQQCRLYRR